MRGWLSGDWQAIAWEPCCHDAHTSAVGVRIMTLVGDDSVSAPVDAADTVGRRRSSAARNQECLTCTARTSFS